MSPWGVDCIIILLSQEPGVQSLRVPALRPAFPADCPHLGIFTAR